MSGKLLSVPLPTFNDVFDNVEGRGGDRPTPMPWGWSVDAA